MRPASTFWIMQLSNSREVLSRCETFHYLGEEAEEKYNELWKQVLSE